MELRSILSLIIIIIFIYFYRRNGATKYYTKFIVFHVSFNLISIIVIPILMLRPKDPRNWVIISRVGIFINFLMGLEYEVRNKEILGRKEACIVVSNHQSSLDALALFKIGQTVNQNCALVAKKELFYIWPSGLIFWLCGSVFIDRKNPEKARETLNAAAQKVKEDNIKLWFFPEGTRRNNGRINSFKKGAFHMAVHAKIDIAPIIFSSYHFMEKKKRFDSGKIIITIMPPMSTDGEDVEELMDKIHKIMDEVFHSTSEETKQTVKT